MLDDNAPFPSELADMLPTPDQVAAQAFEVDAARWRGLLGSLGLPPATQVFGDATRRATVSRSDVAALADAEITTDNAVQLFYGSLAWGLGLKARRLPTRLERFSQNAAAVDLLTDAWRAVRSGQDPGECYEILLTPHGRARVGYFGAAFATKYLYFAHGTRAVPRNLILDQVVAARLRAYAWPDAPLDTWWSSTYQRYCDLLARWADEAAGLVSRDVCADQVEMALFRGSAGPVGD